ncbi:hypothetical protein PCIT_a3385 [Pseudoalteromonas citrea]|uniref:PKD/Chitinase domain-containing protein n=2 Tax=Pseudoalteromonas citrea TaxID=43655 RepID=A0AAD4AGW8_9GAMM|nr:PKD domain-containing protein [Pseudoalteromonas citrea]KAF7768868.1 hypothetical protein PCIT_a3385 [Pseudoalteromonas citrea]
MQIKAINILLASCLLSACGGSDSDDTQTLPQPQLLSNISPTAAFSQIDDIYERGEFIIDASGSSDSDGSISSYNWSLDLGDYTGKSISLTENGVNSNLVVGEIEEDVTVSVNLTVTDNDGATDKYTNTITIQELDIEKLPPIPVSPRLGLEGTDSDRDGVRDDVEIKIYNLYPLSKDNREISRKAAQIFQNVLVTGDSQDDLDDGEAAEELSKLASCYIDHTSLNGREEVAKIRSILIDTPERMAAYENFLMSRNGTVQRTLEANIEECRLPQN